MDIDGNNNITDNNNNIKLKKLFIRQIYENVTKPSSYDSNDDSKRFLLFNNIRLDKIYIQGVVIKIVNACNPKTGIEEVKLVAIDDGTAIMYINNDNLAFRETNVKKGDYILAYGEFDIYIDGSSKKTAYLHPVVIKVLTDPNIEILWTLELIHYQEK